MGEFENTEREEIYSKSIRAGKRTYFFDVKATRSNDYYLTITESKKRFDNDKAFFEKHKIFLYKEDFEKFVEGLTDTLEFIRTKAPAMEEGSNEEVRSTASAGYADISFDDLGNDDK
jgi:hypothetical protein